MKQPARRTPWYRPRNVVIALVALLAAYVGWAVWWRVTAVPAPVIDYIARINDNAASYQPTGENGWPALVDVLAEHATIEAEVLAGFEDRDPPLTAGFVDFDRLLCDPLDPEAAPREMTVLRRVREAGLLDRVQAALDQPGVLRRLPDGANVFTIVLPNLAQMQKFARMRAASMRLALADGDTDEFIRGFDQVLGLANACAHQVTLIDRLTAMAIAAIACRDITETLVAHHLDEETCRALLEAMERRGDWPPYALQLESERLSILDLIQSSFSDDGHGDGRLDTGKLAELTGNQVNAGGAVPSILIAGRRETTDLVNEFFDNAIEESRRSWPDRERSPFDPDAFAEGLSHRHLIVRLFIPAIGKAIEQQDYIDVWRRGARLMLLLEIHRHEHGDYPDTLAALSAYADLDALADPYTDEPFVYRRIEPDAHGRSYVLYSVNTDGRDDHADAPLDDLEAEFGRGRPNSPGTDILINRRRNTCEEDGY